MAVPPNTSPEQLQALLEGPALAPPPGVLPNFTDPPNLRRTGVVALLVTLVLSTLAVTMRIYTGGRRIQG